MPPSEHPEPRVVDPALPIPARLRGIAAVGPTLTYGLRLLRAERAGPQQRAFVLRTTSWGGRPPRHARVHGAGRDRGCPPPAGAPRFFHTAWLITGVSIYVLMRCSPSRCTRPWSAARSPWPVPIGRHREAVLVDLFKLRALAEAGHILISPSVLATTPQRRSRSPWCRRPVANLIHTSRRAWRVPAPGGIAEHSRREATSLLLSGPAAGPGGASTPSRTSSGEATNLVRDTSAEATRTLDWQAASEIVSTHGIHI